ncbi:hypothetical protein F2P79_005188 [Pimephales promelas]|nr:hypothetical protein F2P79_005188 [Pimephales promelas]
MMCLSFSKSVKDGETEEEVTTCRMQQDISECLRVTGLFALTENEVPHKERAHPWGGSPVAPKGYKSAWRYDGISVEEQLINVTNLQILAWCYSGHGQICTESARTGSSEAYVSQEGRLEFDLTALPTLQDNYCHGRATV